MLKYYFIRLSSRLVDAKGSRGQGFKGSSAFFSCNFISAFPPQADQHLVFLSLTVHSFQLPGTKFFIKMRGRSDFHGKTVNGY